MLIAALICQVTQPAAAQIVPDGSLGQEASVVISEEVPGDRTNTRIQIDGGLIRDTNLFHSFQEFNVDAEQAVFFKNPTGIETIFSRVTGSNASRVFGTLGVSGAADLFFLNPNGIIFGPGATLELNGSFITSTASQIEFEDGETFSTDTSREPPLLTVSAPTGLGFQQSGPISVQGMPESTTAPDSLPTVLTVPSQRSLILIGGDIEIDRAILSANSGRLEVGGVEQGRVGLYRSPSNSSGSLSDELQVSGQWFVDYAETSALGNVNISRRSVLDASGSGGGTIQVQGENVALIDDSVLFLQHQSAQPTDSITVRANDTLSLLSASTPSQPSIRSENPFGSSLVSQTAGRANSQPITIETNKLRLENANLSSFVLEGATGSGSDINITATESVEIGGVFESSILPPLAAGVGTVSNGPGRNGDITLSTRRLSIERGGSIGTQLLGNAQPGGGNIFIDATDIVELTGSSPDATLVSTIAAITATPTDAGNLTLNTQQLLVSEGAGITSVTGASGSTGKLNINASESITITGVAFDRSQRMAVPIFQLPSFISASVPILTPASGDILNFSPRPSGDSGRLNVTTPALFVQAGGVLGVDNQGTGNAGDLRVRASNIVVGSTTHNRAQSEITAATASGEGGNISLFVDNLLLLQQNGVISSEAGEMGDGGNITIESDFIVASPGADSDIIANAFEGNGGSIDIVAQRILGLSARPSTVGNGTNDIDASSQLGTSGTVTLNEINATPTQAAPSFSDFFATAEISQHCNPSGEISSFVATGRGGIPLGPETVTISQDLWEELYIPSQNNSDSVGFSPHSSMAIAATAPEISEAQGWRIGADGVVQLFAQKTTLSTVRIQGDYPTCALTNSR